jgi:hypothetical protein
MIVIIFLVCLALSLLLIIVFLSKKRRAPSVGGSADTPIAWSQKALFAFLEDADEKYMLAFTAKNVNIFTKYCTNPCAQEVQNRILYYEKRNFGLPGKRKRKWTIMSAEDNSILLKKELTHAREKKTHFTTGDDITEYWKVIYNSKFLVCSIRA